MQLTVRTPTKLEADAIRLTLPVDREDLGEDGSVPRDFPGLVLDGPDSGTITLVLDFATRSVRDWPAGREAHLYVKVCDAGVYELLAGDAVVATRKSYVPSCVPGDYGDYVGLRIYADGGAFEYDGGRRWRPIADDVADAFFGEEE